jgi:hypothetical protein
LRRLALAVAVGTIAGIAIWTTLRTGQSGTQPAHAADGARSNPAIALAPRRSPNPDTASASLPAPPAAAPLARADASLPPPDSPMRLVYGRLKELASQGDAHAQCRLGFELQRCASAPDLVRNAREHESKWGNGDNPSMLAWTRQLSHLADKTTKTCHGFVPDKGDEAWRYILQSALAGNDAAIMNFVFGLSAGLNPEEPTKSVDGWAAYRDYAPQLIQRAIDDGYPAAYAFAGNLSLYPHFGVTVLPKDPVRAAAYYLALLPNAAPAYREQLQRNVASLNLSDADKAAATAAATTLGAKLKVPADGPIDFSRGLAPDQDGRECDG